MEWLLTAPLLWTEVVLVMKLDEETYPHQTKDSGRSSVADDILWLLRRRFVSENSQLRWIRWVVPMLLFLYIMPRLAHQWRNKLPLGFWAIAASTAGAFVIVS